MTFEERNNMVIDTVSKMQKIHSRYTSSSKILTDNEWHEYIDTMMLISETFKKSNLEDFIGELAVCFLNDTERMQKKLKRMK